MINFQSGLCRFNVSQPLVTVNTTDCTIYTKLPRFSNIGVTSCQDLGRRIQNIHTHSNMNVTQGFVVLNCSILMLAPIGRAKDKILALTRKCRLTRGLGGGGRWARSTKLQQLLGNFFFKWHCRVGYPFGSSVSVKTSFIQKCQNTQNVGLYLSSFLQQRYAKVDNVKSSSELKFRQEKNNKAVNHVQEMPSDSLHTQEFV